MCRSPLTQKCVCSFCRPNLCLSVRCVITDSTWVLKSPAVEPSQCRSRGPAATRLPCASTPTSLYISFCSCSHFLPSFRPLTCPFLPSDLGGTMAPGVGPTACPGPFSSGPWQVAERRCCGHVQSAPHVAGSGRGAHRRCWAALVLPPAVARV